MVNYYISPPFGNYLEFKWATSIKGSYTLDPRPGLIWQALKTIRPVKGGWRNAMGLRNKGIKSVEFNAKYIYSIAGIDDTWFVMQKYIPEQTKIELNLSCPNTKKYSITFGELANYQYYFDVQAKIAPTVTEKYIYILSEYVKKIHIANTINGVSGYQLKSLALPLIEKTKKQYPKIHIIAGGGIYTPQDIIDYKNAGADGFSLATVFFNPIKAIKLIRYITNG